uniref:Opioid receptor, delta 1a n=1 Tax=Neolamprologus brichardi TaxID=32507 RepID=A0A3Q4FYG9_NEOBR
MILRLRSVRLLSGSKEKDRNMRRITRMVLVVVAAFIICWTPIHIFIIVKTMIEIDSRNPFVIASWHLCIALGYTNSSLNPVLYAFLDENFKRCFRDFCLPCRTRVEQNSLTRGHNTTRDLTYPSWAFKQRSRTERKKQPREKNKSKTLNRSFNASNN